MVRTYMRSKARRRLSIEEELDRQKAEDFVSDQARDDMEEWMFGAVEGDDWYEEDIETRAEDIADRLLYAYVGKFESRVLKKLHKAAFKSAIDAAEAYFNEHPGMRELYYDTRAIAHGNLD